MLTLGFDTSNYTTSVAAFDGVGGKNCSRLLDVKPGELGLRQSDALFAHIKRLPELVDALCASVNIGNVTAIGVSTRPRAVEGSYMPCFLAGWSQASCLAKILNVPLYEFSHQQGHIAASLWSAGRLELMQTTHLAWHLSGGTTELLERIAAEAETPVADVMFGGGVESLESYRDLFAPYTCAEADAILPQYRAQDDIWTPFSSLPLVFVYNPKLVGAEEITGWADLLRPELAGKIAFADPSVSGSSYTALVTMLCAVDADEDAVVQAFAANLDGRQLTSSGAVLSNVAGGQAVVGVTLEETASRRIAAGDELAMVYPADGTSCVPDGSAILKGAPHEDNARAFVDFTVSRDVQQLIEAQFCRRSVRSDLDPAGTLPPFGAIAQVDYDVSFASERRESLLMSWAFYLGTEEEE